MASSSRESCDHHTAGMSKVQIKAVGTKSRKQGWSELKDGGHSDAAGSSGHDQDTGAIWSELKRKLPGFFTDIGERVQLGRLIAEGGQAHIYEARILVDRNEFKHLDGASTGPGDFTPRIDLTEYIKIIRAAQREADRVKYVAKVYKMEGFSLADLQRQWPFMTKDRNGRDYGYGYLRCNLAYQELGELLNDHRMYWCSFLKDGRFAFLMQKAWGDLRTLIDLRLSGKINSQEPPFSHRSAIPMMREIASGMQKLHARGVLHRDLKAANILLFGDHGVSSYYRTLVADFESSMFVQGTGFWRAPEVLVELQKNVGNRNAKIWTEKVDVYAYAMTCYEILTGDIPFHRYVKSDWKKVIDGERPHLPDYIDPNLRELVERCWHIEPCSRPTFAVIQVELNNIYDNLFRH